MQYVELLGRTVLALVFVASAVGKLKSGAAFVAFRRGLADMRLLPTAVVPAVAVAVVTGEVVAVVLLGLPGTGTAGLVLALVLLASFTAAIAVVLARGTRVSCPCFGGSSVSFGRRHLVRNGLLLGLGVAALVGGTSQAPLAVPAALLSMAGAVVIAMVVVTFEDIADVLAPSLGSGNR
ncbi:MauE/DoxX family redox-associated membrane protein [Micromonospora maritima]|uniref:MauE/DoxX family redox-associated membrane protein n=1 Tax=Micromonospora maritima TaxID=986711 RepID=UPI00157DCF0C|nr:MauE/DoxX family redox-associated membrane protein [Micromonospora maritima]